ncbi:MAG: hypothetical protein NDJ94_08245 [Vicinamibacteria bacterium]|nr:hypothetical protein [Vicinamibacteria bacterium]
MLTASLGSPGRAAIAACLLLASAASAAEPAARPRREQVLVRVVSEPEDGLVHELVVVDDGQGRVVAVVRRSRVDSTTTTVDELARGPVAMARAHGRDAILLACLACDPLSGGDLELRYLHNGITGSFRALPLKVERAAGRFRLATRDDREVRQLRLKSRTWLGILIGIAEIEVE